MDKLAILNQKFSIYLWTIAGLLCGFFLFPMGETKWFQLSFILIVSFLLIINFLIYNHQSIQKKKTKQVHYNLKQILILFGIELLLLLFVLLIRFDVVIIDPWYGLVTWWLIILLLFLFIKLIKHRKATE